MNVPILDLDDGLTRLALAKIQQIVCAAASIRTMADDDRRRIEIERELHDVLACDELRLWLDEIGLGMHTDRVAALVRGLMAGKVVPNVDLYANIRYTDTDLVPSDKKRVCASPTKIRGKTGYRGVTESRWGYVAYCFRKSQEKNKRIHLGYHSTAEAAARAYNTYVIENGLGKPLNAIEGGCM